MPFVPYLYLYQDIYQVPVLYNIFHARSVHHVINETAVGLHVYRKGTPIGVGWVIQGWGGSYRNEVGHEGVEWVMQGRVGHTGVGWVMQGWVGHAGVRWVMLGWGAVGHVGVG